MDLGLPDPSSIATTTALAVTTSTAGSDSSSNIPWKILGKTLGFSSHDQELWWRTAAPKLNKFLIECNYDVHLQYQYLSIFHRHIVPVLGPFFAPGTTPNYVSRLSKHGHPLDISVNFQESGSMVRMSFGTVGSFAGLQQDPLNQSKTNEVLVGLTQIDQSIDLQFFNHFESEFYISHGDAQRTAPMLPKTDWATKMLSVDMRKNGQMRVKVYYMICAKSVATGIPAHTLVFDAIQRLGPEFETGLSLLREFVSPMCESKKAYLGLLGIDCIPADASRIKVYVHFNGTREAMRSFWTLGGTLKNDIIVKSLEIIDHVCELLQFSWADDARTIPILINYDIKRNSLPKPQLYLFLTGRNDRIDAERLQEVFQYLRWKEVPLYQDKGDGIASLFPNHDLDSTTHIHRGLSLSFDKAGGPYMSIYYDIVSEEEGCPSWVGCQKDWVLPQPPS